MFKLFYEDRITLMANSNQEETFPEKIYRTVTLIVAKIFNKTLMK